ncbi:unnamed protein product [Clavelina lepadiformis]|uniref:PX domain-containing protein n=3 Tax=Clavelina lepadiformis TaxID=159417 RepID=A0ABP0GYS2_CLALP
MQFTNVNTRSLVCIQAFNLYVNGGLHCVVRYSQLHALNEQLKQECGMANIPPFPPKHFFSLKGIDLEDRKLKLEKYIQEVSQDSNLSSSESFVTFLCRAQQETQQEESIPVSFEVSLMNGSKLKVNINSTDKTDDVLENVMSVMGLSEELTYYFGLFLIKGDLDGNYSVVRKLQEFECPYISLKSLQDRRSYKVLVRKTYWDQSIDETVAKNHIGLNLLVVQAQSDVATGWTKCPDEAKQRLKRLYNKGSKLECLHLCQTLQNYGYLQFHPCLTDFPSQGSRAVISAGNYELKFRILSNNNETKEKAFLVTRIKCWKISSHINHGLKSSSEKSDNPLLQLSFEYLVSKGNLRWVSLLSDQAIVISMCIKSMVDELIRKRKGERIRKPADRDSTGVRPTYKPRDKTTEALFDATDVEIESTDISGIQKAKESVKKISEKLSSVSIMPKTSSSTEVQPPLNEISQDSTLATPVVSMTTGRSFEGIGDEDL